MPGESTVLSTIAFVAADTGPAPWAAPLGIGIFVVVGGLSLAAIVWSFRRRRRDVAASSSAVHWTRPESYDEHHTVVWEQDPAEFRAEPRHWPLAVAAIFGICSGDPWEQLRHRDVERVRAEIAEAWGIRSRPQQLAQMHALLTVGHRAGFAWELVTWRNLEDAEAARVEQELARDARTSEEAAETLWRFRKVRANERDINAVDFTAWDLVRFTMLCRAGVTAGYLSEAEALDSMLVPSMELRARYHSWQQLGQHFTLARWYWHSQGGHPEAETDAHDASRVGRLLAPPRGPWSHVPWDVELPQPQLLLADAMISEELITPVPESTVYTEAGEWFDQVVRLRLGVPADDADDNDTDR